MIDLNYKPRKQPETWQPEEIACAFLAIGIWVTITILFFGAL